MSTSLQEHPHIGRPFKIETVDELQIAIEAYFALCEEQKRPYTMAGLARALDIARNTLLNYEHRSPAFMSAVRKARARVEQWTEEGLWGKYHPAGPIFSLKNNFGWKDTQEIEHTHTLIAIGQPGSALPQQLEPPCIDAQVIDNTSTFASDASLSPVPLNSYAVEKPAK